MASKIEQSNVQPIDTLAPFKQIPFDDLKKEYSVQVEDWILHQKTINANLTWVVYRPHAAGLYNVYHLGFSNNPESVFYSERRIDYPIIIEARDKKTLEKVLAQLNEYC